MSSIHPLQSDGSLESTSHLYKQFTVQMNQQSISKKRRSTIDRSNKRNSLNGESCCPCTISRAVVVGIVIGALTGGLALALIFSFWLVKSANTTTMTTSTTTTTVTITCATGYSLAPSGISCANLLIDFNNCGSFDYVCPSNYTSCSAGVCSKAPAVYLKDGVTVFNVTYGIDDMMSTVQLPLNLTMYNYSSSSITFTTNGVVCLGTCATAYSNGVLPTTSFPGPTAFGFWDDLYLQVNTSQNIYYAVSGTAPNRTTTFEFYTTHLGQYDQYYHFQILFYENRPNIVKFIYFDASDGGVSATVGVQKSSTGPNITYSVNQANSITSNLTITFNTNTGTYTV